MLQLLILVGRALALALRGHRELVLENLALRQQLIANYRSWTQLGLEKDAPDRRPVAETSVGHISAVPEVGGLHHRYERRAA